MAKRSAGSSKTSASTHRKLNQVRELGVHCHNGRLFSYQKHGCRHAGPRSAAMRGLTRNSPGRSPSERTSQEIPATARSQGSIGTQWPQSKGLASHPHRKRERQRRRPTVDASSTPAVSTQAPGRLPKPRPGDAPKETMLQARRTGRLAPADADEEMTLYHFRSQKKQTGNESCQQQIGVAWFQPGAVSVSKQTGHGIDPDLLSASPCTDNCRCFNCSAQHRPGVVIVAGERSPNIFFRFCI